MAFSRSVFQKKLTKVAMCSNIRVTNKDLCYGGDLLFKLKMRTILKFNTFWLKKAIILLSILVLGLNMPINGLNVAWGYNNIMALIPKNQQDSLLPQTKTVILTAYSSTSDQTDSTPFITASNTKVRDGVIASNFLAFGTKILIPSLFGDKIFTVEDRMARKHSDKIDIWFPERHLAKRFGVQEAEVIILE